MMVIYGKIDKLRYGKPSFAPLPSFHLVRRATRRAGERRHRLNNWFSDIASIRCRWWCQVEAHYVDSHVNLRSFSICTPHANRNFDFSGLGPGRGDSGRGARVRFSSILFSHPSAPVLSLVALHGAKSVNKGSFVALAHCLFFTPISPTHYDACNLFMENDFYGRSFRL